MNLERGFKAEARRIATSTRGELLVSPFHRLDPHLLASHLGIPVITLSELQATCRDAHHFLSTAPEAFSALTVFKGHRRLLVHNDSHSPYRQNSNLAHELAHSLLQHAPAPALDGTTGCRNWNNIYEREADWLAGELLVTSEMALAVARGRVTMAQAQITLMVSSQMLNWRLNVTGARKRVARERARRHAS